MRVREGQQFDENYEAQAPPGKRKSQRKKGQSCRSAGSSHSTPKVLIEKMVGNTNADEEFKKDDPDSQSETSDLPDEKQTGEGADEKTAGAADKSAACQKGNGENKRNKEQGTAQKNSAG